MQCAQSALDLSIGKLIGVDFYAVSLRLRMPYTRGAEGFGAVASRLTACAVKPFAAASKIPSLSYIRTFKEPHKRFLTVGSGFSPNLLPCRFSRQAPAGSCDCSPSPPVETFTPPRELCDAQRRIAINQHRLTAVRNASAAGQHAVHGDGSPAPLSRRASQAIVWQRNYVILLHRSQRPTAPQPAAAEEAQDPSYRPMSAFPSAFRFMG
jgi:hypothetical protein